MPGPNPGRALDTADRKDARRYATALYAVGLLQERIHIALTDTTNYYTVLDEIEVINDELIALLDNAVPKRPRKLIDGNDRS